jgi:hypothetical protein
LLKTINLQSTVLDWIGRSEFGLIFRKICATERVGEGVSPPVPVVLLVVVVVVVVVVVAAVVVVTSSVSPQEGKREIIIMQAKKKARSFDRFIEKTHRPIQTGAFL